MTNAPKVVDLYSGVGGLSFGAVKAGFELLGAVENEKRIIDCHKKNFPASDHLCSDISKLDSKALSQSLKLKKNDLAGLIGGPPCQGFSSIGKRSITDNRNNLFVSFYRLAAELNPAFFLAENVPGILNEQYDDLRAKATKLVENEYNLLSPLRIVHVFFSSEFAKMYQE
jgi:DNA (cytosine-5)-methyltransferase 1